MATALTTLTVSFELNGRTKVIAAAPLTTLRTALREQLHMHATKAGCGQGGCGSCTVLLDGELVLSCLLPLALAEGRRVTTLEGLGGPGRLHPLQEAFHDNFAAQCGYCTAGMIMSAKWLLDRNPNPSRAEIQSALAGNLCRCTGYLPIIEAVEEAARRMKGAPHRNVAAGGRDRRPVPRSRRAREGAHRVDV